MKKNILKLVSAGLIAVMTMGLVACGGKASEAKTFTVGFDANFPPYGYQDNGEYVGFDIDLAKEVASRKGWNIQLKAIDWDSKDLELNSGTIDCIWNGFTMNGREDKYTWTKPYVDNSQVFVVAKDSGISSFADLAGKAIVVQAASSALDALNDEDAKDLKASFGNLVEVPDYNTAFMNLEAGAVNAVAMDIGVAKYQIASRGDKFVMLEQPIVTEQYAIGFKLGNTALKDEVETTLLEMVKDGKFGEIASKWDLTDSVALGK